MSNATTYALYTLGCKLNFAETSAIGRQFEENGMQKVDFQQGAAVYLINTCSVTDHADRKCKRVVREALKHNPDAYIIIVGCYAQLKPEEIASIPGVDLVLGANDKFKVLERGGSFTKNGKTSVFHQDIEDTKDFYCAYSINDRTRTFLKVQDGCDYSCTFCTIPLARGASRSDTPSNILAQAKAIAKEGVREIVLTGVNIGDYGIIQGNRSHTFLELIQGLDEVEGIDRFRISSIEPNLLSDEIIRFVASSKRFVPHFHVPLQSGSDAILKAMRRRYLSPLYAERVAQIRAHMPYASIGVDVITGFPGETEEAFLETMHFLNELDISYLHVFTYSERANTPALEIKGKVKESIRQERTTQLRSLSDKKSRSFYSRFEGQSFPILWESSEKEGWMSGFTPNYLKVIAPYTPECIGEITQMKLGALSPDGHFRLSSAGFPELAR
jgi:threonylcarbamoyladenosine tRNA methylthiotransferase MtaB